MWPQATLLAVGILPEVGRLSGSHRRRRLMAKRRCPELGGHGSRHIQWTGISADCDSENPALMPAVPISRAIENIVKGGRGMVAFHGAVHESQDAVEAVDSS